MICNSIHQVLFQRVVEQVNLQQPIIGLFKRYSLYTILFVLPTFSVLFAFMPTLVTWLLGADWEMTATCIRWMLPWLCITCLSSPICFVADVFMQQKTGFVFEILIVLMRLIGLMIGVLTHSFINAIIGYCLMSTAILFVQWLWFI
jgi:O-antigen/teichoic acid export membrane protein